MSAERIRAHYNAPKKGKKRIRVLREGTCALCPSTWSLTQHHVFGSNQELTVQLCRNCHFCVHKELEGGAAGPFTRHVLQMLAQVFPVAAPLPEWTPHA